MAKCTEHKRVKKPDHLLGYEEGPVSRDVHVRHPNAKQMQQGVNN